MTTNPHTLEDPDTAPPPGRWDFLFSWTGLFFVGWVLYELTSQAVLGVTIFCCKLGWEDFRTGIWLRHKDPIAARGKMEMWIYIASGLWRTAIAAFIIMMVLMTIAARMGVPAPDELEQAGLTAMVGFTVCALTTMRALWLALWHRRKLWLHPAIHEPRKDDVWPPIPPGPSAGNNRRDLYGKNKAGTLIVFSITSFSFVLTLIGFAWLSNIGVPQETRIILFTLFIFFGYPLIILAMRDYQKRHLLAACPEECWRSEEAVNLW
jgi:hypothetical protein